MKITLTVGGEVYETIVDTLSNDTLAQTEKKVMNAASETFGKYAYANKLGRYAK